MTTAMQKIDVTNGKYWRNEFVYSISCTGKDRPFLCMYLENGSFFISVTDREFDPDIISRIVNYGHMAMIRSFKKINVARVNAMMVKSENLKLSILMTEAGRLSTL
jgi:hypothetical protein